MPVTDPADFPDPADSAALTHLDAKGAAHMVDISAKDRTVRVARARAVVELTVALRQTVLSGQVAKGEALGVARLAGIQAAKETSRLIPLCHPLALSGVEVQFAPLGEAAIEITAEVKCVGPTGVEMEAMTAVSVAALALYDMCKSVHKGIRIRDIVLLRKSGGRSGLWQREAD